MSSEYTPSGAPKESPAADVIRTSALPAALQDAMLRLLYPPLYMTGPELTEMSKLSHRDVNTIADVAAAEHAVKTLLVYIGSVQ